MTDDAIKASFTGVGAHGNKHYGFEIEFYLPVDEKVIFNQGCKLHVKVVIALRSPEGNAYVRG